MGLQTDLQGRLSRNINEDELRELVERYYLEYYDLGSRYDDPDELRRALDEAVTEAVRQAYQDDIPLRLAEALDEEYTHDDPDKLMNAAREDTESGSPPSRAMKVIVAIASGRLAVGAVGAYLGIEETSAALGVAAVIGGVLLLMMLAGRADDFSLVEQVGEKF